MQYTNEYSGSEGRFFRNRKIGGVSMENDALPQYMRIARSIAQRIADGELMEGEKLSGRSKLSSEYNVSPETIRKAVQVLQDRAVVIVREQSGVYVLSAEQARQCLAGFKDGGGLIGKKHRLRQLLEQQQALGRELQELCGSILDEMILPAQAAQSLPNYCVRVPEDWDGEGKEPWRAQILARDGRDRCRHPQKRRGDRISGAGYGSAARRPCDLRGRSGRAQARCAVSLRRLTQHPADSAGTKDACLPIPSDTQRKGILYGT